MLINTNKIAFVENVEVIHIVIYILDRLTHTETYFVNMLADFH